MQAVRWLEEPGEQNLPAAAQYLSLLMSEQQVAMTMAAFDATSVVQLKAKDVLRASRLPALDERNRHVARYLRKIAEGEALSPLLLVRGDASLDLPLVIADGYHRASGAYHLDENVKVPCKIAALPAIRERTP